MRSDRVIPISIFYQYCAPLGAHFPVFRPITKIMKKCLKFADRYAIMIKGIELWRDKKL